MADQKPSLPSTDLYLDRLIDTRLSTVDNVDALKDVVGLLAARMIERGLLTWQEFESVIRGATRSN